MNYKNNMAFAIRTILLEKKLRTLFAKYSFTIAAGAILNALSAIRPNKCFLVKPTSILDITDKRQVEKFLKNLRDGLAHKTKKNFKTEPNDKNEIISIKIGKRILSIDELYRILEDLEKAIADNSDYEQLYEEEKKRIN